MVYGPGYQGCKGFRYESCQGLRLERSGSRVVHGSTSRVAKASGMEINRAGLAPRIYGVWSMVEVFGVSAFGFSGLGLVRVLEL